MFDKTRKVFLGIVIIALMLAGCAPQTSNPDQPVSSDDTPAPTKEPFTVELEKGEKAIVEEMDILIMESFPLQISVAIKGQLPDGCTTIGETKVEKLDDTTFAIRLITERPKDAICIQVLAPFEVNVPLDVYGLPAGTYTVKVYDLSKTFTFSQDNIL